MGLVFWLATERLVHLRPESRPDTKIGQLSIRLLITQGEALPLFQGLPLNNLNDNL